ncbi:enhancer of polycomb homolog 1-like [Lampetra fluviatilis]
MSKLGLSFRARALDASKPLPIFRAEDLPDLQEYVSINRTVPQMPTGMEKEEETEHHLQRAISAQQVYGEKPEHMVIPVPEAQSNVAYYDGLYKGDFKRPKTFIHLQPLSLEVEHPDYDLDSEDETFVNKLRRKVDIDLMQFEEMMDRLEKGCGQQLLTLPEAQLLLPGEDSLIREVFEYWLKKRRKSSADSLIPTIKQERRDGGSSSNNPYIAFRRRTEKMQTRKNRKNDEASYEKMLKLRRDLSRAITILEMIRRRERNKRELLHLTLDIVEKRNTAGDYDGAILGELLAQTPAAKPVYTGPMLLYNGSQYRHTELLNNRLHSDLVGKRPLADGPRPKRKYEKRKYKTLSVGGGTPVGPRGSPRGLGTAPPSCPVRDANQYDFPSSEDEAPPTVSASASEGEEEEMDPDAVFVFRRAAGCSYLAPRPLRGKDADSAGRWEFGGAFDGEEFPLGARRRTDSSVGVAIASPAVGAFVSASVEGSRLPMSPPRLAGPGQQTPYYLASLRHPHRIVGLARRRVGRGGRMLLDRLHTPLDKLLQQLNPDDLPGCGSPLGDDNGASSPPHAAASSLSPARRAPATTSLHPTSCDRLMPEDLMAAIRACRWRHFRPRSLASPCGGVPPAPLPGPPQGGTVLAVACPRTLAPRCTGFTLEHYHNHLVQLQRQQQEAMQTSGPVQGSSAQSSRTLDSESAQFAVSAVLGGAESVAPPPVAAVARAVVAAVGGVRGRSPKEVEGGVVLPPPTQVNGILQPRGMCKLPVPSGTAVGTMIELVGHRLSRPSMPPSLSTSVTSVATIVTSAAHDQPVLCAAAVPTGGLAKSPHLNGIQAVPVVLAHAPARPGSAPLLLNARTLAESQTAASGRTLTPSTVVTLPSTPPPPPPQQQLKLPSHGLGVSGPVPKVAAPLPVDGLASR